MRGLLYKLGRKAKLIVYASFKHTSHYIFIFQFPFSFLGSPLSTFMLGKQYGKDFYAIVYALILTSLLGAQKSGCDMNNNLMYRAYSAKRV